MAKPKGSKKEGGRRKGVPNKATALAREAIAEFVDGNAHRLAKWLDQIADDNPKDAFNAFMSVVEYHIPKLARTERQDLDKNGQPTDRVDMTKRILAEIPTDKLEAILSADNQ